MTYREPPTHALFLDLDGTVRRPLVGEFINNPANQEIIPGVQKRLAKYDLSQWIVFGLSNQGGVSYKDKFNPTYLTLEDCMEGLLITLKVLDPMFKIYAAVDMGGKHVCHVTRQGGGIINVEKKKQDNAIFMDYDSFRKPGIGMYQLIYDDYQITPDRILMVGDYKTDKRFAEAIGCQFLWAEDWLTGADYEEPKLNRTNSTN